MCYYSTKWSLGSTQKYYEWVLDMYWLQHYAANQNALQWKC